MEAMVEASSSKIWLRFKRKFTRGVYHGAEASSCFVFTLLCSALCAGCANGGEGDRRWESLYLDAARAGSNDRAAIAILTEALLQSREFGKNDLRVAVTFNALGAAYDRCNDLAQAQAAYKEASSHLDELENAVAIGGQDPGNIKRERQRALTGLASVARKLGQSEQEKAALELLLKYLSKLPHASYSMHGGLSAEQVKRRLAELSTGKLDRALSQSSAIANSAILQSSMPDDPVVAQKLNTARKHYHLAKLEEAGKLYTDVLKSSAAGEAQLRSACVGLAEVGDSCYQKHQYDLACQYLERVLAFRECRLGRENPDLSSTVFSLLRSALDAKNTTLVSTSAKRLDALLHAPEVGFAADRQIQTLAGAYYSMGNAKRALELYKEIVDDPRVASKSSMLLIMNCCLGAGRCSRDLEQYADALRYDQRALGLIKSSLTTGRYLAAGLVALSKDHAGMKNAAQTVKELTEEMARRESTGTAAADFAPVYLELGIALRQEGDNVKAEQNLLKCLALINDLHAGGNTGLSMVAEGSIERLKVSAIKELGFCYLLSSQADKCIALAEAHLKETRKPGFELYRIELLRDQGAAYALNRQPDRAEACLADALTICESVSATMASADAKTRKEFFRSWSFTVANMYDLLIRQHRARDAAKILQNFHHLRQVAGFEHNTRTEAKRTAK